MEPRIIFCQPKVGIACEFMQQCCVTYVESNEETQSLCDIALLESPQKTDTGGIMEVPPINYRQPPDGHEFPDYQETPIDWNQKPNTKELTKTKFDTYRHNVACDTPSRIQASQQQSISVRDKIAIFSNNPAVQVPSSLTKYFKSTEVDGVAVVNSDNLNKTKCLSKSVMSINSVGSLSDNHNYSTLSSTMSGRTRSSLDLSTGSDSYTEKQVETNRSLTTTPRMHFRSQSLVDINSDRWSALVEQRRKGLSKLKGLVIPEQVSETEVAPHSVIDLPEIKSNNAPTMPISRSSQFQTQLSSPISSRNSITPSLSSPPWAENTTTTLPKYSPAFKRKSLQIYGTKNYEPLFPGIKNTEELLETSNMKETMRPTNLSLNDAPKSLESITSPTRSDYSFEYISMSPELKHYRQKMNSKICPSVQPTKTDKEEVGKSEDESDNDSAVSSSQSSYISRSSPPASPKHFQRRSCSLVEPDANSTNEPNYESIGSRSDQHLNKLDSINRRLLKPKSVEAINRKNILASAKCRSGRDLKVGSPLVRRKFDVEEYVEKHTNTIQNSSLPQENLETKHSFVEVIKVNATTALITPKKVVPKKVAAPNTEELQKNKGDPKTKALQNITANLPSVRKTENHMGSNKEFTFGNVVLRRTNKPSKTETANTPKSLRNVKAASVTDLRKNFENLSPVSTEVQNIQSAETKQSTKPKRLSLNLPLNNETVTSKRSSTGSLTDCYNPINLSEEEAQKLIAISIIDLQESIPKEDIKVIILRPEITGGSVGITLAGGADYETKAVTVHKVRTASPAFRDGRLQKGDRILSINGKVTHGLTHEQSIAILKEPVAEVTFVASKWKESSTPTMPTLRKSISELDISPTVLKSVTPEEQDSSLPQKGTTLEVTLTKDITGLGFSVEGGLTSPLGDVPLLIKKIFKGGAAEKCGKLIAGDQLLEINKTDVTLMSRIDVWTLMKKLPKGTVSIKLRR